MTAELIGRDLLSLSKAGAEPARDSAPRNAADTCGGKPASTSQHPVPNEADTRAAVTQRRAEDQRGQKILRQSWDEHSAQLSSPGTETKCMGAAGPRQKSPQGCTGWVTGHAAAPQPACATRLRSGSPQQICPGSAGGGRKDCLPPEISGGKAQHIPASCPGSSAPLLHHGKSKRRGGPGPALLHGGGRQTNRSQEGDVRREKALVAPCPAPELRPAP